jgi:hypothetical protein
MYFSAGFTPAFDFSKLSSPCRGGSIYAAGILIFERRRRSLIEAEKRERQRGLVGLNPDVLSVIQRSSLGEVLGRERMHFNLEVAVAKYLAMPLSEGPA